MPGCQRQVIILAGQLKINELGQKILKTVIVVEKACPKTGCIVSRNEGILSTLNISNTDTVKTLNIGTPRPATVVVQADQIL